MYLTEREPEDSLIVPDDLLNPRSCLRSSNVRINLRSKFAGGGNDKIDPSVTSGLAMCTCDLLAT